MAFIPRQIAKDVHGDIRRVLDVHDFDVALQQKGSWSTPQGRLRCTYAARGIAVAARCHDRSLGVHRASGDARRARCDPRRAGTQ